MELRTCKVCQKDRPLNHFIGKKHVCKIRPCPTYASKNEFELQEEFFRLIRANNELRDRVFSIPNGANVSTQVRSKMRKEGMTAGVWDIIGLIPNSTHQGFIMEFKTAKGRLSESQIDWELKINPTNKPYMEKVVFINPKLAYEWVVKYVSS